ncbi:MAG: hypothetical protein WCO94_03700 [Verrucomicrobiota bacterium]
MGLLLACVAFALYEPSLHADFVWDGRAVILINPYVHGLQNLPDILLLRVMHLDVMDNNRPVFLLSTMLEWCVWGANSFGYHLTNVLLHALVCVLLFAFARKLMSGVTLWVPFFATLVFAVHPVNCEAVAEISYRKDLIAAAGILAALNFATTFQPEFSRRNLLRGAACVLSLLLAVGAKENGVAGPFVLGCYWILFRRGEPLRGWLALLFVSLLVVATFLIARFTLPPWPSMFFTEKPEQLGGSLVQTLMMQLGIWAFYFRQIIWPVDLCADYTSDSLRNFPIWAAIAALLAVVGAQIYASVKSRVACLGAALFWLSLLPVSNFVPLYRPIADRFLYLPMCGVALMLAALGGIEMLRSRSAAVAALAVSCALAVATWHREKVWESDYALWSASAATNPLSFTAVNNLAEEQLNRGDYSGAVATAQRAIRLSNGYKAEPYATEAVAWNLLGRLSAADYAFCKAVEIDPRYRKPEELVKALIITEEEAQRLEVIARRNY